MQQWSTENRTGGTSKITNNTDILAKRTAKYSNTYWRSCTVLQHEVPELTMLHVGCVTLVKHTDCCPLTEKRKRNIYFCGKLVFSQVLAEPCELFWDEQPCTDDTVEPSTSRQCSQVTWNQIPMNPLPLILATAPAGHSIGETRELLVQKHLLPPQLQPPTPAWSTVIR